MANWTADDGTGINFEIIGDATGKDTLLLLPGLLGAITSQWQQFVTPLARDYRVILPDWRGHGHSDNKDTALRPGRMLQDIVGLLNYLRVNALHVAGYDFGGYMGLMLYLNQPRRVASLLMHGTKFYWNEESVTKFRAQLDPDVMAQKVPVYANQLATDHGSRWRILVRQAADMVATLSESGVTEGMVSRVQIPVVVSVGDRDELVSLPEALRLSRKIPQGKLLVLPGTRHPLQSVQQIPLLPMMQDFHRR